MSIRRWWRQMDEDALARAINKTPRQPEPLKHLKPTRSYTTYRWFRRNEQIHGAVKGVWRGAPTKLRYAQSERTGQLIGERRGLRDFTFRPNGERECLRRMCRPVRRAAT